MSLEGINRLITVEDRSRSLPVEPVGNAWSRLYFDGPFFVHALPPTLPAVSLVFVQSRDGNTGAGDPAELGGGPTDKHLIYEGLSRVAADAVLAGSRSVGASSLFTIHLPQLIELRAQLGLPRHPAQVVMSDKGNIDLSWCIFSTPDVRVLLLAGADCERRVGGEIAHRPWITVVPLAGSLVDTFRTLRQQHGLNRISAIGGRVTATSLIDAGLVQDVYLTTAAVDGGEDDTPWYVGCASPRLETVVRKREVTVRSPLLFEHCVLR